MNYIKMKLPTQLKLLILVIFGVAISEYRHHSKFFRSMYLAQFFENDNTQY